MFETRAFDICGQPFARGSGRIVRMFCKPCTRRDVLNNRYTYNLCRSAGPVQYPSFPAPFSRFSIGVRSRAKSVCFHNVSNRREYSQSFLRRQRIPELFTRKLFVNITPNYGLPPSVREHDAAVLTPYGGPVGNSNSLTHDGIGRRHGFSNNVQRRFFHPTASLQYFNGSQIIDDKQYIIVI